MIPSITVDVTSRLIIVKLAEDTNDQDMYAFDAILRGMPEFVSGFALLFDTRAAQNNAVTEEGMQHLLSLTRDDKNFVAIIVADYQNQRRALAFEEGTNARLVADTRVATFVNQRAAMEWLAMKRGQKTVLDYLDSMRHENKIDSQG
jgi:hypothetical protein